MEVLFFAKVVKDGLLGKAMGVQANRYFFKKSVSGKRNIRCKGSQVERMLSMYTCTCVIHWILLCVHQAFKVTSHLILL